MGSEGRARVDRRACVGRSSDGCGLLAERLEIREVADELRKAPLVEMGAEVRIDHEERLDAPDLLVHEAEYLTGRTEMMLGETV